jgi:hypothetical protein
MVSSPVDFRRRENGRRRQVFQTAQIRATGNCGESVAARRLSGKFPGAIAICAGSPREDERIILIRIPLCLRTSNVARGADMNRNNILYLAIGALIVAVVVLGYLLYQERNQPGLHIKVGPLSIEGK